MLWLLTQGPLIVAYKKNQLLIIIHSAYQYEIWSMALANHIKNIPKFCPQEPKKLSSTAKTPESCFFKS